MFTDSFLSRILNLLVYSLATHNIYRILLTFVIQLSYWYSLAAHNIYRILLITYFKPALGLVYSLATHNIYRTYHLLL